MYEEKQKAAHRRIKSVTSFAIVSNIFLFIIKTLIGLLTGSIALISDGIHSLSDLATDIGVLLGVHFSSKEADQTHPYGHGRAETFSAGFIAILLLLVGLAMIYYAATKIAQGKVVEPRGVILVVAVVSVIVKELLYRITRKAAVEFHSTALYANAWHHRSDALSSIAVVIGFISIKFGFDYGDQVAAIAVGIMIVLVAVRIIGDCFSELAESSVDTDTIGHIKNIINSNDQVHQWHKLRTRTVGREIFLDLHILVEPNLDITAAHEIAESLENTLHEQLSRPVNITVHIEPDVPELRK